MLKTTGSPVQINTTSNISILGVVAPPGQVQPARQMLFYDNTSDIGGSFNAPQTHLLARVIDMATGAPIGSEVTFGLPPLSPGQTRFSTSPTLMSGGTILLTDVTYALVNGAPSFNWSVYAYSGTGTPLAVLASGVGMPPSMTALASGGVDVFSTVQSTSNNSTTTSLYKAYYTAAGVPSGSPSIVATLSAPAGTAVMLNAQEYFFGSSSFTAIQELTVSAAATSSKYSLHVPGVVTPIEFSAPAGTGASFYTLNPAGAGFTADGSFLFALSTNLASTSNTSSTFVGMNVYRVAPGGASASLVYVTAEPASFSVLPNGDFALQSMTGSKLFSPAGKLLGSVANAGIGQLTGGALAELLFSGGNVFAQQLQYIANTARDFGGDEMADVLFRNAAGVTYLWTMNGASATGATTSVQVGAEWQVKGVADFDGNGTSDILWVYNNAANAADVLNGVSYVSFQNGASSPSGGVVQQLTSDWAVAGTGDFNADGMADVLYRNTSTGQAFLDVMNGAAIDWSASGATSAQVTDPNWKIAAIADFNGDGMADVLWRYNNAANAADALNGALYEWTMNGKSVTSSGLLSQGAGSVWAVAGTGDFDGDGKADILFRNSSDGMTYVDFMNGTDVLVSSAPTQWQVDNSWVLGSIGDYSGDGKSDLMWQNASTGDMYLWTMNGASVTSGTSTSTQPGSGWTVQNGALIG